MAGWLSHRTRLLTRVRRTNVAVLAGLAISTVLAVPAFADVQVRPLLPGPVAYHAQPCSYQGPDHLERRLDRRDAKVSKTDGRWLAPKQDGWIT